MNNSQRLLYILPDLAYVVELLPTKKPHSFAIHNFRQINGQFLDDNELIGGNIEKLMDKLDGNEYKLVLPDFLFTNTILNITETSEENVKQYLKEKLFPSLDLDVETHEIEANVLTEHKGVFKVQLSALEKTVLEPLRSSIKGKKITISSIVPLSWTIKSIVSLEPSISIIQLGENLYLSQHYIGIDQTTFTPVSDADNLIDTVKTLKGAEPSLQTIYLLSSGLVEEKLKTGLTKTLPLQQLATFKENEVEMPSYVKQIIESAAKTLSIPDYSVPEFPIGKSTGAVAKKQVENKDKDPVEKLSVPTPAVLGEDLSGDDVKLPAPMVATAGNINSDSVVSAEVVDDPKEEEEKVKEEVKVPDEVEEKVELADKVKVVEEISEKVIVEEKKDEAKEPESVSPTVLTETSKDKEISDKETESPILEQFATTEPSVEKKNMENKNPSIIKSNSSSVNKSIIKDKSGVSPMLKMFFVGLVSFFATIGIGVGLGMGYLSLSGEDIRQVTSSVVNTSPSPSSAPAVVEETPTPTPAPEIDKDEVTVLVVNATTKPGYAGKIAKLLKDGGFTSVDAKNAKGEYEDGNYVLMAEDNDMLVSTIGEDSELDYTFQEDKSIEDPKDEYDAVIVLAE